MGAFSSETNDGDGGSVDKDSVDEGMRDMGNDDDDDDDGELWMNPKDWWPSCGCKSRLRVPLKIQESLS